jgi:hypothetical protein
MTIALVKNHNTCYIFYVFAGIEVSSMCEIKSSENDNIN